MNKSVCKNLKDNLKTVQSLLPAEDVLVFSFALKNGTDCAAVYIDGMADKQLLGEQVARPLLSADCKNFDEAQKAVTMPEKNEETEFSKIAEQILQGNAAVFIDGFDKALVAGVRTVPARTIAEPPTDIAVRGPRAGFVEELKTNLALLRARLKTEDLLFKTVTVGRRTGNKVAICYLNGIARDEIVESLEKRLNGIEIDGIPDSSYIAKFISERPHSLFKQAGVTEKPDILAAKMLEGRVGILVEGSPIALTVPYLVTEDFQSSEEYFVTSYRASFTRFLRVFSLIIAIYLPAFYIAAQLFKLQLLPLGLLLTVASSIQGLALSPSMEMFLTLLVLEVLTEASIRMPKYVGLAISVVGALVLGDTAVNAGFLSTPAILIIALSGICLYTVPNILETTSVIRVIMLFLAGSVGAYGIILFTAFLLYYLFSTESYGAPLLAPFSPLVGSDLKDSLVKYDLHRLKRRPALFQSKNKVRLQDNGK